MSGAAAVVGRDHDVTPLHRFADEREHVRAPVAVHATVHPHQRSVPLRAALRERSEQVRGNRHAIGTTAVGDFPELHDANAARGVDAVRRTLLRGEPLVVGRRRVLGTIADVELRGARGVPRHGGLPCRGRGCGDGLRHRELAADSQDERRDACTARGMTGVTGHGGAFLEAGAGLARRRDGRRGGGCRDLVLRRPRCRRWNQSCPRGAGADQTRYAPPRPSGATVVRRMMRSMKLSGCECEYRTTFNPLNVPTPAPSATSLAQWRL